MALIAAPNNKSSLKHRAGNTSDIIAEVIQCYKDSNQQVARYAPKLKAGTLLKTCNNVWAAVKDNINYKIDPPGVQWVRTPARLWRDKEGDCKSFSVFIGSCLHQLQIPFVLRFVSFSHTDKTPTHVYVVVLTGSGEEIILDAVLPSFNEQKPFTYKKDFTMPTQIARLSGIGDILTVYDLVMLLKKEYDIDKSKGILSAAKQAQYNLYFNALLQLNDRNKVSGLFDDLGDIFDTGSGSGSTGSAGLLNALSNGGGIDFNDLLQTGASFIPGGGQILAIVSSIFGPKDNNARDFITYDEKDRKWGNPVGEQAAGWSLANPDKNEKLQLVNVLGYLQDYGFTPHYINKVGNDLQKFVTKMDRVGFSNEVKTIATLIQFAKQNNLTDRTYTAAELLQAYQKRNNNTSNGSTGGSNNTGASNGINKDGTPITTGGSNALLYLGGAALVAFLLFKK